PSSGSPTASPAAPKAHVASELRLWPPDGGAPPGAQASSGELTIEPVIPTDARSIAGPPGSPTTVEASTTPVAASASIADTPPAVATALSDTVDWSTRSAPGPDTVSPPPDPLVVDSTTLPTIVDRDTNAPPEVHT